METSQLHTHTFAWRDHALTMAAAARSLSGRDYLEGLRRGDLPTPPCGAARCEGTVTNVGRTTVTAEGSLFRCVRAPLRPRNLKAGARTAAIP